MSSGTPVGTRTHLDEVSDPEEIPEFPAPERGSFASRFQRAAGLHFTLESVAIVAVTMQLAGGPAALSAGAIAGVFVISVLTAAGVFTSNRNGTAWSLPLNGTMLAVSAALLTLEFGIFAWVLAVGAGVLAAFGFVLVRVVNGAVPYAVRLPGVKVRNAARIPVPLALSIIGLALLSYLTIALLGFDLVLAAFALLAGYGVALVSAGDGVMRIRARRLAEQTIYLHVARYRPRFALHWDAPTGTAFQVGMWLPELERLGVPFIVVLRNPSTFAEVSGLTTAPVLVRRENYDLDPVMVPSLSTVFYVNNAMRNTHMVRFAGVTHVQLNHGDSDKAPSYSPVFRMYDANFVAGQAAVDRFASHRVRVSPDIFRIVGRPQLGDLVEVRPERRSVRRVLYAPTWKGHNVDTDHSSIPIGEKIVAALIDRGLDVTYRPHPYTDQNREHRLASRRIVKLLRDAPGDHVFGHAATEARSIFDCFNEADALIGDISSVTADFVFSLKPYAITMVDSSGDEASFRLDNRVANGAYLIAPDASNIDAVLDQVLGDDPLEAERPACREYLLGDTENADYRGAFERAVRGVLANAGSDTSAS